jgi:hypothetical protein
MIVSEEKRLNVSRWDVICYWRWDTAESRQHHVNMSRQLVKLLEGTSLTKTKAAHKEGNTKEARETRLPELIRKLNGGCQ